MNTSDPFTDPQLARVPEPKPAKVSDEALAENPHWERSVLEKLAFESLKEQRARRRWGIFFKMATLGYIGFIIYSLYTFNAVGGVVEPHGHHTALISIDGVIDAGGKNSSEHVVEALNQAFDNPQAKGVILRINSPGGSPVHAGIIYDEIKRLRATNPNKPVHVVIEDLCASGGYYVAAAANNIYVDKASLVGSIGVIFSSFGVQDILSKIGVERRTLTAGENKAFLDPFAPLSEGHKLHMQGILNEVHQQFIQVVREGRGMRLKETPELFSGLVWNGAKAVDMGLADGFGTVTSVARDVIKTKKIVDYTLEDSLADRLSKRFGAAAGTALGQMLGVNKPDLR
jgi:protease-4